MTMIVLSSKGERENLCETCPADSEDNVFCPIKERKEGFSEEKACLLQKPV